MEDNFRFQAKNAENTSIQPHGEQVSIFALFGYRGRDISAQESSRAVKDDGERRKTIMVGDEQKVSKTRYDGESMIEKALCNELRRGGPIWPRDLPWWRRACNCYQ